MRPTEQYRKELEGNDCQVRQCGGLVGQGITIEGSYGKKPLVYADYVASGRGLRQIDTFVADRVLSCSTNMHIEEPFCDAFRTRLCEERRKTIARLTGTGAEKVAQLEPLAGRGAAIGRLHRQERTAT